MTAKFIGTVTGVLFLLISLVVVLAAFQNTNPVIALTAFFGIVLTLVGLVFFVSREF